MNITVYCGSNCGGDPSFVDAARELGSWIGRARHTLVYGGSAVGLMGVVSSAALAAGSKVIGIEPQFFLDAGVKQQDAIDLQVVDTLSERKARMIELGDVFVALPGGVGTLEEMSEIFTRVRLCMGPQECYLLDIDGFYRPLRTLLESMIEAGFFDQCDLDRIRFPGTVSELARLVESEGERPASCEGFLERTFGQER